MIKDLRVLDDEIAAACGERYDLASVLDAMGGILDDYAAFAKAEGLAEPYTLVTMRPPRPDDDWVVKLMRLADIPVRLPYGPHTPRLLRKLVMKEKEELDAGGLRHAIEAPPYRFDLYPLGAYPLYANFGLCRAPGVDTAWITCEGGPWTDYDPAPIIRIHRHLPRAEDDESRRRPVPDLRLTYPQRKSLTGFLESQRTRGIAFETRANGVVTEPVTIRFPHARFGAGIGDLRIALLRAGGD